MLSTRLWRQWSRPESGELEDLRRNTILEVAGVIFAAVWFMMIGAYGRPENLLVPLILFACSLGTLWLAGKNYRLALAWLDATLIVAIVCQKWLAPTTAVQYLLPVVIVLSSLLVTHLGVFIVGIAAEAALFGIAHALGVDWLNDQEVVTPALLILITACAAWLGSRQMHLALDWMRNSYKRANDLLEQLRDERASLAHTLKMLEDAYVRIEKMNYALIEARSVAENARQLKAEFAANISHELRTPLNLIIGFSETMANAPETYAGVAWTPALRGDIEQIYQSSRHLSSLIDDILDLSALDARRLGLTLQDASIDEVIDEAVAMMQDLFRAKRLYLHVDVAAELPRARVDVTRIRQVLINLLTNASRFTRAGGVTITARQVEERIRVAVQDTGIGIAPHEIPRVFEEFGQVDGSRTRKQEGTGLGVPLSKRLVESHGGHMWLESQPGMGSTFYFDVPIATTNVRSPVMITGTGVAPAHSRKPVLVYEPDPLLLRTIRRHLHRCDVVEIREGAEIPAQVEQHQPTALVVNTESMENCGPDAWGLPDDLPLISIAMTGNLRAAQALGVCSYLCKPVLREQLIDALSHLGRTIRDVLIVDDDPELVELIARMLQSSGQDYHPVKAFGGGEALARLRSDKIDLVLLDLFMPDIDGKQVLEEMKGDPALADIPVIVITAQHPETAATERRLFLQLSRTANASTTETLNYLQALIEALPLRGLPTKAGATMS
jgi:signal transduction histidine kinase/CheY-like chemotaxis protein